MFETICKRVMPAAAGWVLFSIVLLLAERWAGAADPPVINPFGRTPTVREDALPGYVETSDGAVHTGQIYLTRDKRLKILDEELKREREVPLRVVRSIECKPKREWMEKEWKFKAAASAEKMFTGRTYPAREYLHTITLRDGRTITGPLSALVYVQPRTYRPTESGVYRRPVEAQRHILHKDAKGKIGEKLESLVYVKLIRLGEEALIEGRQKAARQRSTKGVTGKRGGGG